MGKKKKSKKKKPKVAEVVDEDDGEWEELSEESDDEEAPPPKRRKSKGKKKTKNKKAKTEPSCMDKVTAVMAEEIPGVCCIAHRILRPACKCPPARHHFGPSDDFDKLLKATTLSFVLWCFTSLVHLGLVFVKSHYFWWPIAWNMFWMGFTYVWCIAICKELWMPLGRGMAILLYAIFALYNLGYLIYMSINITQILINTSARVCELNKEARSDTSCKELTMALKEVAPTEIELLLYITNIFVFWPVLYYSATCAAFLGYQCISDGTKPESESEEESSEEEDDSDDEEKGKAGKVEAPVTAPPPPTPRREDL